MFRPHLLPLLLSSALCAGTPAMVHLALQMDSAPAGASAPDTVKVAEALQAFAKQESLLELGSGGDGWSLGIRVVPVAIPADLLMNTPKSKEGFLTAKVFMRLSPVKAGQIQDKGAKEDAGVFASDGTENFNKALLTTVWNLLSAEGVVETKPTISQRQWKKLSQRTGDELVEFDSDRIKVPIKYTSGMLKALSIVDQPWRRSRTDEEIATDSNGRPLFVIGRNSQEVLLIAATAWMASSSFQPESLNGTPVCTHFTLNLATIGAQSYIPRR